MSNSIHNEALAEEIARGLQEPDSIRMFRALVRRYPEEIIRRAYEETLSYPAAKIRKSRGAIFNFLLKKYGRNQHFNS